MNDLAEKRMTPEEWQDRDDYESEWEHHRQKLFGRARAPIEAELDSVLADALGASRPGIILTAHYSKSFIG
jgi:hypothetical protein